MSQIKKIKNDERGTALLVALLVMGVFLAISLALSSLILREVRAVGSLVDAGRAYYAAESAVEEALYALDQNLPGWDTESEVVAKEVGGAANFEYEVKNKCNSYPCFDEEEYNTELMPAHAFYDVLELNEAITIPLFVVRDDEAGGSYVDPVEDFVVEFYANFNPAEDLKFGNAIDLSGWNVMRWKVFGLAEINGELRTESIDDFTAVSSVKNRSSDDQFQTNARQPSWFGTRSCGSNGKIECLAYSEAVSEDGLFCSNTQARDFYLYDSQSGEFQSRIPCYNISDFMQRHRVEGVGTGLNYLTLTNLMNPDVLKAQGRAAEEQSKVFFRVETFNDDTVREFADITADGFSGGSKKSINVKIGRDSYMPVFNFSLYSTYGAE